MLVGSPSESHYLLRLQSTDLKERGTDTDYGTHPLRSCFELGMPQRPSNVRPGLLLLYIEKNEAASSM